MDTSDNIRPLRSPVRGIVEEIARTAIRLCEQDGNPAGVERCKAILDGLKADKEVF